MVILSHFDKIHATHLLKLGTDQREDKEGVVTYSYSHFDKINACMYATHLLKLGTDQREDKEGVVTYSYSHFDKIYVCMYETH